MRYVPAMIASFGVCLITVLALYLTKDASALSGFFGLLVAKWLMPKNSTGNSGKAFLEEVRK
jgi:hypothetical protein